MPWRIASFICGVSQCATGLAAMVWWYSYSVRNWVQTVVSHAVQSQSSLSEMKPHAQGLLALTLIVSSPVTWIIIAWSVEGLVRILAAAITSEVFATLPLALIAGAISPFRPVRDENPGLRGGGTTVGDASLDDSPARSFANFLRRGIVEHTHAHVPDDVTRIKDVDGDLLRIRTSHTKPDWEPGRIVRVGDVGGNGGDFYRIDRLSERHGAAAYTATMDNDGLPHTHTQAHTAVPRDTHPRPFVYLLRHLAAGVANRHTLNYEIPPEARAARSPFDAHADPAHVPVSRK
ncbi:MAG: hypothetical protein ABSC71_11905 [Candidatus Acidiferrales bacterium]